MGKLYALLFFVLIYTQCFSQDTSTEDSINEEQTTEFLMYYYDSPGIMSKSELDIFTEKNYLKENISAMSLTIYDNRAYIHWNVCDEATNSQYAVYKTFDGITNYFVGSVKNNPCSIGIPILYGLQDANVILDKNIFYKLYKIRENGEQVHIITVIVPKINKNNNQKSLNKNLLLEQVYGNK